MFKDVTLGQYYPADSCIHRLDPRTKILCMILYIVAVFLVKRIPVFLLTALFVLAVTYMAKVPVSYLWRSLKPLRLLLVFMFVLNLFLIDGGKTLWEWGFLHITTGGVQQAAFISLRLILLVSGASLLTLATTPISLTDGLERLLEPLKKIRFPAHELAMMMTIALRFIPTLIEEADKIMKAQLSRGADFESGNLVKRVKAMAPILVPLFVNAFKRADELAMAMESRCYHGGEGRSKLHVLRYCARDAYAFASLAALIALILLGNRVSPW